MERAFQEAADGERASVEDIFGTWQDWGDVFYLRQEQADYTPDGAADLFCVTRSERSDVRLHSTPTDGTAVSLMEHCHLGDLKDHALSGGDRRPGMLAAYICRVEAEGAHLGGGIYRTRISYKSLPHYGRLLPIGPAVSKLTKEARHVAQRNICAVVDAPCCHLRLLKARLIESGVYTDVDFPMLSRVCSHFKAWRKALSVYMGGDPGDAKLSLIKIGYGARPVSDLPFVRKLAQEVGLAAVSVVSSPDSKWSQALHCGRPNPIFSRLSSVLSFDEARMLDFFTKRAKEGGVDTNSFLYDGSDVLCRTFQDEVAIARAVSETSDHIGMEMVVTHRPAVVGPHDLSVLRILFNAGHLIAKLAPDQGEHLSHNCLVHCISRVSPDIDLSAFREWSGPLTARVFNANVGSALSSAKSRLQLAGNVDLRQIDPSTVLVFHQQISPTQGHWSAVKVDACLGKVSIFDSALPNFHVEASVRDFEEAVAVSSPTIFIMTDVDIDLGCAGDLAGDGDEVLLPHTAFTASCREEIQRELLHLRGSRHVPRESGRLICKFCPFRQFVRKANLISHLDDDHLRGDRLVPHACNKQMRVARALHDFDRVLLRPTSPESSYLAGSASFLREQLGGGMARTRSSELDRAIVLVLDENGPRYIVKPSSEHSLELRRCGDYFYTREFARLLFRSVLLENGTYSRVKMDIIAKSQAAGNLLTSLLPVNVGTWQCLVEDVMKSPQVSLFVERLIEECARHGEYKSLSIDSTKKPGFTILGQAGPTAPAYVRANQALPAEEQMHDVITVRGRTSAIAALEAVQWESSTSYRAAIMKALPARAREQVVHCAADSPSRELFLQLRSACPNLASISLDPLHLPFAYEAAFGKTKSQGSVFLRQIMAKLSAASGPLIGGPMFLDDNPPPASTRLEAAYRRHVRERSMSRVEAMRVAESLRPGDAIGCREELVQLFAALVKLYPEDMDRPSLGRGVRTVHDILVCAAEPARLEWYLNAQRFRQSVDWDHKELLPIGTCSNEAFHLELKNLFFGTLNHVHTVNAKLRALHIKKLLCHNAALYSPTIVQMSEAEVCHRVVPSLDLWSSWNAWQDWCEDDDVDMCMREAQARAKSEVRKWKAKAGIMKKPAAKTRPICRPSSSSSTIKRTVFTMQKR